MEEVLQEAEIAVCIDRSEDNSDCCIRLAEHYHATGEYKQAFHWYNKAAGMPDIDPNVYFYIGYAYQHGQGCPIDLSAAYHWYLKAAENHVPQAMYNLAFFYQNGLVVAQSEEKAVFWLQSASFEIQRMVKKTYDDAQSIKTLQRELFHCHALNEELRHMVESAEQEKQNYLSELSGMSSKLSFADEELKLLNEKYCASDSKKLDLEKRCEELDRTLVDKSAKLEMLERQNALSVNILKQMEKKFSDLAADYEAKVKEYRQAFETMNQKLIDENRYISAKLNYNAGLINQFEKLLNRSFVRKTEYMKIINQLKYAKVISVDKKERYFKVCQNGKWGIINQQGKIRIPLEWDEIGTYSDTLTAVRSGNLWGYTNRTGKVVLSCQWGMAYSFHEDEGRVVIDGAEKKINKKGKILE